MTRNQESRSIVRNLTHKDLYIKRDRDDKQGILIPPMGTVRMNDESILELAQEGYVPFIGIGQGNHATLFIENEELRKELYFEDKENRLEQIVLTKEIMNDIFNEKSMKYFKQKLEKYVTTRAEKHTILKEANVRKINDAQKIREIELHTGLDFYNPDKVILP